MNQMFSFIVEYKSKHDGNSPTFKEIMIGVGFATTSHVSYWMERLKKSGRISYSSDRRSIEVKGGVWKLKHPMID
jgi:SOS-response transcriptional repressor LexA